MAHDLHQNHMVYAGDVPWHGLGTAIPTNVTVEDMWSLARFFNVEKQAVYLANGSLVRDRFAIVRQDTGEALPGVSVSADYTIVQSLDLMREATVALAADGVGAVWHTAGLFGRDAISGWAMAEIPGTLKVKGDTSEIRKFFLVTFDHSGKMSVQAINCATRVVCANTQAIARSETGNFRVSIRHTASAPARIAEMVKSFRRIVTGMAEFEAEANRLASIAFNDAQFKATLDEVLPLPVDGTEGTAQLQNKRDAVLTAWDSSPGMAGIRGTAWGALQAWTWWTSHGQSYRGEDKSAKAMQSVWFGKAADLAGLAAASINNQIVLSA